MFKQIRINWLNDENEKSFPSLIIYKKVIIQVQLTPFQMVYLVNLS